MVNPMKNKKCHHYYDQEAVLEMIKARHKNKKKFRYVVPALSSISSPTWLHLFDEKCSKNSNIVKYYNLK